MPKGTNEVKTAKVLKVKRDIPKPAIKRELNPKPAIKIQNIVVSADLHATIDLYSLSKNIREVDYEPEQFPGAIFRLKEPAGAVIILFKNGKLICTGSKTEADVKRALEYATKAISKYIMD
jgi:transcription initiation factor TFIID TATA-box-binding protein